MYLSKNDFDIVKEALAMIRKDAIVLKDQGKCKKIDDLLNNFTDFIFFAWVNLDKRDLFFMRECLYHLTVHYTTLLQDIETNRQFYSIYEQDEINQYYKRIEKLSRTL